MAHEAEHEGYLVSDDPARIDAAVWHEYLQRSYWAAGMARPLLEKGNRHSLCVGVYAPPTGGVRPMVGGGRVITDRATFAYLSDVFVLEGHRGRGLSKAMMACILSHPDLQGLRRFALFTRDAQGLYARFGFGPCPHPDRYMERRGQAGASGDGVC